jgi:hypothetical protein
VDQLVGVTANSHKWLCGIAKMKGRNHDIYSELGASYAKVILHSCGTMRSL